MKMYKLHNNIGLIRGHALLQIRNFFPKDNAISRIIGTLQFLSADTSTILRLFLLLRSISITDDDNFIIFAWKLSSEHFSINQFQYTLHISSLINSSSTITELTWTSSRGTRANARNTNKSSRSSKQRKCGQGRNSHRPLQKEEEEEEKNPLRSEFPPVPSNGNFSSPRAFSLPASAVFPREPRAISFPYIAYTIPSPPSRSSSSSNLSRGASPPPRPPFSFCASRRGACARKRREASASCRGRRTNVVGQPTDRPSRPSVLLSARPVSSREPSRGLFQSFHPQSAPTLLFPIPSVHNTHRTQRPAAPRARVSPLREAACSSTAARPSPPRVGRRKMGRTPRATRAGSIAK